MVVAEVVELLVLLLALTDALLLVSLLAVVELVVPVELLKALVRSAMNCAIRLLMSVELAVLELPTLELLLTLLVEPS